MMLTKLHITLLICFFIPFIQSYTYRVDLYADSQLNNMSLTKGVYKNITIEIHPNDLTTPLVSGKTTLSISDQRFKLSDGEIVVDTNKRRTYHTYLGISCNAEVTEEEMTEGIHFTLSSSNGELFTVTSAIIIIEENVKNVDLIQSAMNIPYTGFGGFLLKSSLLNVDDITLSFSLPEESTQFFGVEPTMLIKSSSYEFSHYTYVTKYFSKDSTKDAEVEIQAKLDSQCFELTTSKFTVKAVSTEVISDIDKFNYPIVSYSEDYSLAFGVISGTEYTPSMIHCVTTLLKNEFPSDEEIMKADLVQENLRFFKNVFGDNNKYTRFIFDEVDKTELYKVKCLVENNKYESTSNKSIKTIENTLMDYSAKVVVTKPICIYLYLNSLTNDKIDEYLQTYLINYILGNSDDYSANPYLIQEMFDIQNYYSEQYKISKSICISIDKKHPEIKNSNIEAKIKQVKADLATSGLKNIGLEDTEYELAKYESVNYYPSMHYLISTHILEQAKDHIKINIGNKIDNTIECFYRLDNVNSQTGSEFTTLVINPSESKNITLELTATEKTEKYIVRGKCSSFLNYPFYIREFPITYFDHNNTISFNCDEDKYLLRCLEAKQTITSISNIPILKTPFNVLTQTTEAFKTFNYDLQKSTLEYMVSSTIEADLKYYNKIIRNAAQLDLYFTVLDCNQDVDYTACIENKKINQFKITQKFYDVLMQNKTVDEYFKYFPQLPNPGDSKKTSEKNIEPYILTSLYKIYNSGNVAHSFNLTSYQTLLTIMDEFYKYKDNLFQLMKDHPNSGASTVYRDPIPEIYKGIIPNIENVYVYLDAETKRKKTETNSTVIDNESFKAYRNSFIKSFAGYYIKQEQHEVKTDYFDFSYKALDTQMLRELEANGTTEFSIGNFKVTVPKEYLISDTEKVKGILFFSYDKYPLINSNITNKVSGVISMRKYLQDDTIIDDEYVAFTQNSTKFTLTSTAIDSFNQTYTYCSYFKENKIVNDTISTKIENNTIECSFSFFGDIFYMEIFPEVKPVDPDKPTEPKGPLEWWMIVIIVVVVLGIVIVGVILIKKKKTVTSDNLEHGPDGGLLGDYNSLSSKETV